MSEPTKQRKSRSTEAFDGDLEWFLIAGPVAMRERGTLGAVVNVLELGGVSAGGVPNSDLYSDAQVGYGKHPIGEVERYRWLESVWFKVAPAHHPVLMARYLAPRAAFRSDAQNRTGTESLLGEYAGIAFLLTADPMRLLTACREAEPKRLTAARQLVGRELRKARQAAKEAHDAWTEAKTGRPRRKRERVAVLPVYVRPEAAE